MAEVKSYDCILIRRTAGSFHLDYEFPCCHKLWNIGAHYSRLVICNQLLIIGVMLKQHLDFVEGTIVDGIVIFKDYAVKQIKQYFNFFINHQHISSRTVRRIIVVQTIFLKTSNIKLTSKQQIKNKEWLQHQLNLYKLQTNQVWNGRPLSRTRTLVLSIHLPKMCMPWPC